MIALRWLVTIADELHYPNYHFAVEPAAEQYRPRPADAVLLLNAAFHWPRERTGLALYDGVGELDISAVYDAHAATAIADGAGSRHRARARGNSCSRNSRLGQRRQVGTPNAAPRAQ